MRLLPLLCRPSFRRAHLARQAHWHDRHGHGELAGQSRDRSRAGKASPAREGSNNCVVVASSPDRVNDSLSSDYRLTLVTEDALAFLKRQPAASYDLVFADALAGKYEGLDEALRVVKAGGFYVIDDVLPQPNWPDSHAPKVSALIATLSAHPGFRMIPLAWASGIVVAVRKQS